MKTVYLKNMAENECKTNAVIVPYSRMTKILYASMCKQVNVRSDKSLIHFLPPVDPQDVFYGTIDQSYIARASFPSDPRNPSVVPVPKKRVKGLTPKIVDAVSGLFYAELRGSCFVEYLNLRNIFSEIERGFNK